MKNRLNWRPIEELEEGKKVLLWQKRNKYSLGGFVFGSIRRDSNGDIWVDPENIGGYEFECDVLEPSLWAEIEEPEDLEGK